MFLQTKYDTSTKRETYKLSPLTVLLVLTTSIFVLGSIEIKIYDDPENGLAVDIIDTGIGISEHFVHELFKPFTQEDHGYTRKFDGMGLGLTLVERYCKINKAKIEVNSVVSKGSNFTVTFYE